MEVSFIKLSSRRTVIIAMRRSVKYSTIFSDVLIEPSPLEKLRGLFYLLHLQPSRLAGLNLKLRLLEFAILHREPEEVGGLVGKENLIGACGILAGGEACEQH